MAICIDNIKLDPAHEEFRIYFHINGQETYIITTDTHVGYIIWDDGYGDDVWMRFYLWNANERFVFLRLLSGFLRRQYRYTTSVHQKDEGGLPFSTYDDSDSDNE